MSYLDTYKTPAACHRKAPVRRETTLERVKRQYYSMVDWQRERSQLIPHEGPPVPPVQDPISHQYYTPKKGGKQCRKRRK